MAANDSLIQDLIILRASVSTMYIIILLPVCIYILYLGFKQWESKKNDPSWFISYTDFFTYNLVVMELVSIAGYVGTLCVIFRDYDKSRTVFEIGYFRWYGEMMFPTYTCIEHYVAVVHPVTFLGLKNGKGRLIRNISTGLVWVITFASMPITLTVGYGLPFYILDACQMIASLSVIFYCSVAVLKVLIHPKPGGAITDKRKVQKSKRHAFFVIVLVLVVLSLKLCLNSILNVFWSMDKIDDADSISVHSFLYCKNLLTSLTLPLLYLQRAGKLQQCLRKCGRRK